MYRHNVENTREDLSGGREKRGQESVGSVSTDRRYQENINETEGEAHDALDLNTKDCRESVPPLSYLMTSFFIKKLSTTIDPPLRRPMRVA